MGFCGYLAGDDAEIVKDNDTRNDKSEYIDRYFDTFLKFEKALIPAKNQMIFAKFYLYKHLGINPVICDLFDLKLEAYMHLNYN